MPDRTSSRNLAVLGLERTGYHEVLELQRTLADMRINGELAQDTLVLVEHPPVITLGRGSRNEHVVTGATTLAEMGIDVVEVERGGDVTFHGPGQLVGYPILDLTNHKPDLHWFLRGLEQVLINALGEFGIVAGRNRGYTGVWVDDRKIASIGLHVKKWVTWHGFALNVTTDLDYFDLIVPCGIKGVTMTSMRRELGTTLPRDLWGRTLDAVVMAFGEYFNLRPQPADPSEILPPGTPSPVSR